MSAMTLSRQQKTPPLGGDECIYSSRGRDVAPQGTWRWRWYHGYIRGAPLRIGLIFLIGLSAAVETSAPQEVPQEIAEEVEISTASEENMPSTGAAPAIETAPVETKAVMEIQRLDTKEPLYSFELRDADVGDLFRVLAHDYKLNLLVDKDVSGQVTASLTEVSLEEALQTIAQSQNLKLEKKGNVLWIVPHLITKIFILKYIEAKDILASSSESASAEITTVAAQTTETVPSSSSTSTATSSGPSSLYDLLSEKGKVLLGRQPNSLVVIDYPPSVEKVEAYLKEIDQKMSSRVFKLKYLKASDVVGQGSANTTSTSSPTTSTTVPGL